MKTLTKLTLAINQVISMRRILAAFVLLLATITFASAQSYEYGTTDWGTFYARPAFGSSGPSYEGGRTAWGTYEIRPSPFGGSYPYYYGN